MEKSFLIPYEDLPINFLLLGNPFYLMNVSQFYRERKKVFMINYFRFEERNSKADFMQTF